MTNFSSGNSSVQAVAQDLIKSSLLELNVIAPGEPLPAAEAAWGLEKLQRMIDQVNARRALIYNVNFSEFTLQANHSPQTIGPGGDFDIAQRPVKLVACALVLTSGTKIDLPMSVRDDAWWAAQRIKDLTSTLPTDVYYSPDIPLGNLYFWPVPTQVNNVRLELWTGLQQAISLTTRLALPPAYWDFLVYSLAISLAPSLGAQINPVTMAVWQKAIKAVEGNNNGSPRMATQAAGMPSGTGGSRPEFNFLTGQPW